MSELSRLSGESQRTIRGLRATGCSDEGIYALLKTDEICRGMGLKVEVDLGRAKKSYHVRGLIRYGAQSVSWIYRHGFREYESLRGYFDDVPAGMRAVHHLVLHEVAHAVIYARGRREVGSVHNMYFVRVLNRLHGEHGWEE